MNTLLQLFRKKKRIKPVKKSVSPVKKSVSPVKKSAKFINYSFVVKPNLPYNNYIKRIEKHIKEKSYARNGDLIYALHKSVYEGKSIRHAYGFGIIHNGKIFKTEEVYGSDGMNALKHVANQLGYTHLNYKKAIQKAKLFSKSKSMNL